MTNREFIGMELKDISITRASSRSLLVTKILHIPTGREIEFAQPVPKTDAMQALRVSLRDRRFA